MERIFLWFYCLPIRDAVLILALATAAFLLLRYWLGNKLYWKIGIPVLFFAFLAAILFGTLGQRTEGGNLSEPIWMPFYSYYTALNGGNQELYRSNFMNMALFYPAGLLGCQLLPAGWKKWQKVLCVAGAFLLMSIAIELLQYRFGLGLAETDDVIHNVLGALLGAMACGVKISLKKE